MIEGEIKDNKNGSQGIYDTLQENNCFVTEHVPSQVRHTSVKKIVKK